MVSFLFILLSVVLSVSAADNDNQALCIILGCGTASAQNDATVTELCKKYRCSVPQQMSPVVQPSALQLPPQDMGYPFYQQLPFVFEGNLPGMPQNIDTSTSLTYLAGWPGWGQYLQVKDLNAWKQTLERIRNETNIKANNWLKQLENWLNLHKESQTLFNRVSGAINMHMGAYDDLMNFLAMRQVPVPFFNWFKDHLVFHPPTPQIIPHPLNPQIPDMHFPQPMPPMLPPTYDQFGFLIPGIPGQGDPTKPFPKPPNQGLCPTSNNCGSVNVTFDVRVGNVTHCSAFAKEPKQKLKNLLILASHSHKCLTFTTTRRTPSARSTSGEFLYSVDGITETMQHKWIIYLKSSKKHADLNNYWPSDGDYFVIDYVDANTLQNMKK